MNKKCNDCKAGNCGNDFHTVTKYKTENSCGDRLKVILLQCYDMAQKDNLQISEIKSLLNNLIDQHFTEEDRL